MRLEDLFHEAALLREPALPVDVAARVRRRGNRQVRAAALGTVLVVIAAALLAVNVLSGDRRALPASQVPAGWSELPKAPLIPRRDALAVTVGDEAFFLGGWAYQGCQEYNLRPCVDPGALRDGAAYNVTTRSWRRIASAPVAVGSGRAVAIGSKIYVDQNPDRRMLVYDVPTNSWSTIPGSLRFDDGSYLGYLMAAGSHLIQCHDALGTAREEVYDPAAQRWSYLPALPVRNLQPSSCASDGSSLLVIGTVYPQRPDYAHAAIYDFTTGSWRVLHSSRIGSAYDGWSWDGTAFVNASQDKSNGGLISGGQLDPISGAWSLLPKPPVVARFAMPQVTASSLHLKAYGSQLWDTQTRTWITVPKPASYVAQASPETWVGDVLVAWGGGRLPSFQGFATISGTGGLYQLTTSTTHPRASTGSAVPAALDVSQCRGPKPCTYSTDLHPRVSIDGKLIPYRGLTKTSLSSSRTYTVTVRVTVPPGVRVASYFIGVSHGPYGLGPVGPTGTLVLQRGTVLDDLHPITFSLRPSRSAVIHLVLGTVFEVPGGAGLESEGSIAEFAAS